jgi:choline-glycine betaine transporter
MKMYALYWTNTISWIFVVLAHWNNISGGRHVTPFAHIILVLSQLVFVLITTYLEDKQPMPISLSLVWPDHVQMHDLSH